MCSSFLLEVSRYIRYLYYYYYYLVGPPVVPNMTPRWYILQLSRDLLSDFVPLLSQILIIQQIQQTMGSNCARTIDVTHDIERNPTTTETRVAYDNSSWHAINTTYINSTKETSSANCFRSTFNIYISKCVRVQLHMFNSCRFNYPALNRN